MQLILSSFISPLVFVALQSLFISWAILKLICWSTPELMKFLYISSGKSTTNARLLGGLSLSFSLMATCASMILFFPEAINQFEKKIFSAALLSLALIKIYGYVDDKFEVRVRFKLSLQLISIFSFAFTSSRLISPEHPTTAFIASSVLGLALINGTNLIDGLDTLSVKLGIGISIAFLYLGLKSQSFATVAMSVGTISSLATFYFFNREPAKVYMGEIGGGIMGFIFYTQSVLSFDRLHSQLSTVEAISLVLIAASYPIFELGISFLRRLACKKSPFRGDRLHIHYILRAKLKLSASQTSSRLGAAILAIMSLGMITAERHGAHMGLGVVCAMTLQGYLSVCLKAWLEHYKVDTTYNVFQLFEGKQVKIINSAAFHALDISLDNKDRLGSKKKAA